MLEYDQHEDDHYTGTPDGDEACLSSFASNLLNPPSDPEPVPSLNAITLDAEHFSPNPLINFESPSSSTVNFSGENPPAPTVPPPRIVDQTRLRLIAPKPIAPVLDKPWHDMRLLAGFIFSSSRNVEVTADFHEPSNPASSAIPTESGVDGSLSDAAPSTAARRLSLIPHGSLQQAEIGGRSAGTMDQRVRRNSLTPLSYFSDSDAVEQYVEQAAVTPIAELPDVLMQLVMSAAAEQEREDGMNTDAAAAEGAPLKLHSSAEHFHLPRHSIFAGIKIEITPPSAIREANNFILDTVIIEVRNWGFSRAYRSISFIKNEFF